MHLRGLDFQDLRVVLLMVAVGATACLMPAQADTYWHLRAGQDLFQTGHVPLTELYSHSAHGLPWPNHEWLWQALSYGAYRLGGMPLLVAVGAACATFASGLAYQSMTTRPAVSFLLALVGIPLGSVVWALRPQVVSLLFLMILLRLLITERFWLLPVLFLVWANLHGAVALGGLVLVTAAVVSWFDGGGRFARLATATVISGLVTAVTPLGVGLWWFIGESIARSRQNQILEWRPANPRGPMEIAFWLAALALVALTFRRWRRLDSWADRVVVVAALALLPLGARAVRNIAPFFLLWMPAMSRLIGPGARLPEPRRVLLAASALVRRRKTDGEVVVRADPAAPAAPELAAPSRVDREHPRLNLGLAIVAVLGAVLTVLWCWSVPIDRLGWRPLPAGALAQIAACPGPLYNRYDDGGTLIWFAPQVPVFVDSRQDPYPATLLSAHAAAERTGDFGRLFARYRIGCAALPPASLVARGLAAAGWAEKYRDQSWVILYPPAVRVR